MDIPKEERAGRSFGSRVSTIRHAHSVLFTTPQRRNLMTRALLRVFDSRKSSWSNSSADQHLAPAQRNDVHDLSMVHPSTIHPPQFKVDPSAASQANLGAAVVTSHRRQLYPSQSLSLGQNRVHSQP